MVHDDSMSYVPVKEEKPMRDAEKLVAWVRDAADELEKAHKALDKLDVPRGRPDLTLAARIVVLYKMWSGESVEREETYAGPTDVEIYGAGGGS